MLESKSSFHSKYKVFVLAVLLGVNPPLLAGIYDYSHISIGYTAYDMDYEEPGVMNESSDLNDIKGYSISAFHHNTYVVGLEYESLKGNLHYDGATFSGTPIQTETKDEVWNGRVLIGYTVSPDTILYFGYGFRHWFDDLVISYTRTTEYQYVPLGLYYNLLDDSPLKLFFLAEYDYFIEGKNKSTLSRTGTGRNDVTVRQSDGYGFRLALESLYSLEPVSFGLDMFYQYWALEDSESKPSGFGSEFVKEPKNNTSIFGITFKVVY